MKYSFYVTDFDRMGTQDLIVVDADGCTVDTIKKAVYGLHTNPNRGLPYSNGCVVTDTEMKKTLMLESAPRIVYKVTPQVLMRHLAVATTEQVTKFIERFLK